MAILILLLVILGTGTWGFCWYVRKEDSREEGAGALIREAASVTMDFLEAGQVVSMLSGGNYLGTISLRLHQRKHNQVGYTITMYDSGNLRSSYEAYRKDHPKEETEGFRVLEQFLDTYGGCYDPERNALVYMTRHSAGAVDALEGEAELKSRIARHPLAEMESLSRIHTKYVEKL